MGGGLEVGAGGGSFFIREGRLAPFYEILEATLRWLDLASRLGNDQPALVVNLLDHFPCLLLNFLPSLFLTKFCADELKKYLYS